MAKLFLLICLMVPTLCSASDASFIMAEILVELNHFPNDTDKSFLDDIAADAEATDNEKALALCLGRVAHKYAAEDNATLRRIESDGTGEEKLIASAILTIDHTVSEKNLAALKSFLYVEN